MTFENDPRNEIYNAGRTGQDAYDLTMALLFDRELYISDVKAYARAALRLTDQDMVTITHGVLAGEPESVDRMEYTARGLEATSGAYPMSHQEAAIYDELIIPLTGKLGELAVVQEEGRKRIMGP